MGGRGGEGGRGLSVSGEQKDALMKWAKNATQLRLASIGKNEVKMPFYSEYNQQQDRQRAEQIEKYVNGHSVNTTIYRGISELSDADYEKYTKVGNVINQSGLSSWTTDKRIAVGYGQYGKSVVFVQKGSSNARKLGNLTGTSNEKEVIVGSDNKQQIIKVERGKNGITYVYTKDVKKRRRRK